MRIYSYYCEFPLVEVHPKMCNSAAALCGFSQSSVNYRMRRYTVPCEFPHEEKCITPCGYTREKVNFPRRGNSPNFDFPHMRIYTYNCEFPLVEMHPKMRISAVRIYTFFWCITACGDTQFNVNVHMRKSVFPRTRICTVLSEFPRVEIHKSMCKSALWKYAFPHVEIHMRSCISACGNTPKIVNFPTCGNTHFLVYFHMRKFERESEFPHVSLQADL